ncbi:MAG TPA: hypothetical protein VM659_23455 [Dongiaceae bacterium]|nr:hypothetical protein [Dongiaceae bacterium]
MRIISSLLALFYGVNGLVMLFLPVFWYGTVPGVTATGPLNLHFVRDIGLGFLAASAALALFTRCRDRRLLWPAVIFLAGHAMLHLVEIVSAGDFGSAEIRDLLLIVIPGLLPLVSLMARPRRRPEPDWTRGGTRMEKAGV